MSLMAHVDDGPMSESGGHGDIGSVFPAGRVVAAILLFAGIGVVGVITALVASVMLDESAHEAEVLERLDSIDAALKEFRSPDSSD